MALLRLKAVAEVLGVHPVTLRRWADESRVPVVRPGRERRFRTEELERFLGLAPRAVPRREALYVRVSGTDRSGVVPGRSRGGAARHLNW